MKIRNQVDDAAFEAAWADADNQRMMNSVARRYRPFMADDDVEQLKRIGMLNALASHDHSSRRKFITSLRLRTLWVFKTQSRSDLRKRRLMAKVAEDAPGSTPPAGCEREAELRDVAARYMSELSDDERAVVRGCYMEDRSVSEVGRIMGLSRHRVEQIKQSGMFKLKRLATFRGELDVDHARVP